MNKLSHLTWLMTRFIFLGLCATSVLAADKKPDEAMQQPLDMKGLLPLSLADLFDVVIISTASKTDEKIQQAPGIISVVTANEIERFGANNLTEVLERVVGTYQPMVYMYPHNVLAMRGDLVADLDTHVLLLLNGRPFKDGLTGGINYPIYSAFPLTAIDHIEVVRGPGSVLYGTNAFSGVINIITKKAASLAPGESRGEVSMGAGSLGTRKTDAYFERRYDELRLSGSVKYFHENGWDFKAVDEENVEDAKQMNEHNVSAYLHADYSNWSLDLMSLKSREAHMGELPWWSWNGTQADSTRYFVDLGYKHHFSKHQSLQGNLTYNQRDTTFNSVLADVDEGHDDWVFELTHYWKNDELSWLLGGTAYKTSGHTTAVQKSDQAMVDIVKDYRETWYTLYTQMIYQPQQSLRFIAGGQAVKPAGQDWSFVPRLGIIYQFNDELGIKALYSKAYRAAFEFENSVDALPVVVGNTNLEPETVNTYDLQLFYKADDYQWALTYFNSHQENLIIQTTDTLTGLGTFNNQAELRLHGWELEGKFKALDKLIFIGSAAYQENRRNDLKDYTTVPSLMLKLGVSYEFSEHFSVGLYDNYFSSAHDVNIKFGNTRDVNPPADAIHLMTLNLDLDIGQWFGVSNENTLLLNGYIYNLLDEDVYSPEMVRGEINTLPSRQSRGVYLGLKYYF